MDRFSANPRPYENALALISALNDFGIEAYITTGGISIFCELEQVQSASQLCLEFGTCLNCGDTSLREDLMRRSLK